MANSYEILNKIARNMMQKGYAVTQNPSSVVCGNLSISYAAASIQSPMGGVNGNVSPFLGIGIANPGILVLTGVTGTTIPTVILSATELAVMVEVAGYANDVQVLADDGVTQLAYLLGTSDWLSMGS